MTPDEMIELVRKWWPKIHRTRLIHLILFKVQKQQSDNVFICHVNYADKAAVGRISHGWGWDT